MFAFDLGTEVANCKFGHFQGSAQNNGGFKLYGTNDPDSTLERIRSLPIYQSLKDQMVQLQVFHVRSVIIDNNTIYHIFRKPYWAFTCLPPTGGLTISSYGLRTPSAAVSPGNTLTFPSSNGFDCFERGDVVQGAELGGNL